MGDCQHPSCRVWLGLEPKATAVSRGRGGVDGFRETGIQGFGPPLLFAVVRSSPLSTQDERGPNEGSMEFPRRVMVVRKSGGKVIDEAGKDNASARERKEIDAAQRAQSARTAGSLRPRAADRRGRQHWAHCPSESAPAPMVSSMQRRMAAEARPMVCSP